MEKINLIKDVCKMMRATHCEICDCCGKEGVIVFDHDEFVLSAAFRFRVDHFKEDIQKAYDEACELCKYAEDEDEQIFYYSVKLRLVMLSKFSLD